MGHLPRQSPRRNAAGLEHRLAERNLRVNDHAGAPANGIPAPRQLRSAGEVDLLEERANHLVEDDMVRPTAGDLDASELARLVDLREDRSAVGLEPQARERMSSVIGLLEHLDDLPDVLQRQLQAPELPNKANLDEVQEREHSLAIQLGHVEAHQRPRRQRPLGRMATQRPLPQRLRRDADNLGGPAEGVDAPTGDAQIVQRSPLLPTTCPTTLARKCRLCRISSSSFTEAAIRSSHMSATPIHPEISLHSRPLAAAAPTQTGIRC